MGWLEAVKLLLKFVLVEFPKLLDYYSKLKKDNAYNKETDRIEAAISKYKNGKSRSDKLDGLKELEK